MAMVDTCVRFSSADPHLRLLQLKHNASDMRPGCSADTAMAVASEPSQAVCAGARDRPLPYQSGLFRCFICVSARCTYCVPFTVTLSAASSYFAAAASSPAGKTLEAYLLGQLHGITGLFHSRPPRIQGPARHRSVNREEKSRHVSRRHCGTDQTALPGCLPPGFSQAECIKLAQPRATRPCWRLFEQWAFLPASLDAATWRQ